MGGTKWKCNSCEHQYVGGGALNGNIIFVNINMWGALNGNVIQQYSWVELEHTTLCSSNKVQ